MSGAPRYYHTDHLGSTGVVTDSSGHNIQDLTYYPFGQVYNNSGNVDVRYKFTGKELDNSTDLYFYEARYYDAWLGRFISADTIVPDPSDPQSFNRYTYTLNNPLRYTDPTGHYTFDSSRADADWDSWDSISSRSRSSYGSRGSSSASSFPDQGLGYSPIRFVDQSGNLFPPGIFFHSPRIDPNREKLDLGSLETMEAFISFSVDAGLIPLEVGSLFIPVVGEIVAGTRIARITQTIRSFFSINRNAGGGRLGNQITRDHVRSVANELRRRGYRIERGGNRFPEEYIPGPDGGRKGSSFPDITATKNGRTLRVNTIDTRVDNITPSARELTNATKIRSQKPGDHLLLIPKPK